MLKRDILAFYKNASAAARAVNVTKSAASQWGAVVPERIAYRFQTATRGKLKVDPAIYRLRDVRVGE